MFEVGFSELCLIGLVSLLVIGPEKLPKVMRLVGFWLGKTRSMVVSVKEEIKLELQAEERNLGVGAGKLSPGFSPGAITVNGNLNLAPTSVLNIELGGLTQGTGYDYVNVLGAANLAGTLNVLSYGGYTPAIGTNYTFMNFTSSAGSFGTVNLQWANLKYNVFANHGC